MQQRKPGQRLVSSRSRLQPKRESYGGISFDSKAEASFYRLLRGLFPTSYEIQHPFKVDVPGKTRDWKVDFCIQRRNSKGEYIYCSKLEDIKALLQQNYVERDFDGESNRLLIEFKGAIDPLENGTEKSGKIARLDTNFISRINHFVAYAPWVLDDLICVGLGSGAVLTYCKNYKVCATPVFNTEFFKSVVKSVF